MKPYLAITLALAQVALAQQYKPPRTPDGRPDLQGLWANVFATPLERPRNMADKPFFTETEAAAFEKDAAERPTNDSSAVADPVVWWEKRVKSVSTHRTSLVYDPPDGRIPALTAAAQKRQADTRAYARQHPNDGPEDFGLQSRCILSTAGGPIPMLPAPYNNNYQIVQTPDYVMIAVEMIHDVRIVRITDGKPALKPGPKQWLGESVGHWEGDTLVVDTFNFTDQTSFRGSDSKLHLIERFTRTGAETLLYQFTIDDPTAFTAPWSAEIPLEASEGPMFEFACHEGNAGLLHVLQIARKAEAEKAGGKQ